MGETLIILAPFIIGSAVVPLQVMMIILLLNSPNHGLAKAIFLVAGMTTIRLLQGVIFGLILSPSSGDTSGKSPVVSTLLIVLGILLLITAYKQWRNEDDPDGPPPKWMVMLDSLTTLKAFGIGAGLVLISGKFWVFTLSAISVIEEAQLGQPSSTVAFLLFVLMAQSLLLLAIIVRIVLPGQSKSILDTISAWLKRYNRPIVVVVSLVFGCLFFYQGYLGLLQR
jgi:threonine/homoserine/homoserine lactone efflux protein